MLFSFVELLPLLVIAVTGFVVLVCRGTVLDVFVLARSSVSPSMCGLKGSLRSYTVWKFSPKATALYRVQVQGKTACGQKPCARRVEAIRHPDDPKTSKRPSSADASAAAVVSTSLPPFFC